MAKSSYFGNSAKLLSIVSALLFLANALIAAGSFWSNAGLSKMGSSLSSLALYVVLVLGYIALNGEGVGHKRYRDRKSKRIVGLFKLNLFVCFVLNFMKGGLTALVYSFSGTGRFIGFVFLSLISTIGSYGFVLCGISLWYIFRDSAHKKLLPFEITAFVFGAFYNLYKLFNYAFVKYGLPSFSVSLADVLSDNNISKVLCLLQLLFDIVMFAVVCLYYCKKGDAEQRVMDNNAKELPRARNVYKDEGYGIDTIEDDFLLPSTTE